MFVFFAQCWQLTFADNLLTPMSSKMSMSFFL